MNADNLALGSQLTPEAAAYAVELDADGRFAVKLPAAELDPPARAALRADEDDPALGRTPFVKLDADGIHIITPLGRLDELDRTDHVISRRRARDLARALLWLADAKVEVTRDGIDVSGPELPQ